MPTSALSLNGALTHVWLPKTRDHVKPTSRQCLWMHKFCSSKRSVATEKGIHLSHAHLRSMKIQCLRKYIKFVWRNHSIISDAIYELQYLRKHHSFAFSWEMSLCSQISLFAFCRDALFHCWAQEKDDGRGGEKCGYPMPSSRWVFLLKPRGLDWFEIYKYILQYALDTIDIQYTSTPSDPSASLSAQSFCSR